MHEPHAIELPNGRLLGAIRVHNAEFFTTFITFSDDKGKTWSTPKRIGELDGAPPHLMVHSSGAVICSYSCRTYGKMGEKAVVSYDNGETWTEDYELDLRVSPNQHDLGYPSTVELEDGSLYTVYYQAYGDEDMTSLLACKWRLNGK
ncbi:MAG: exo-alpha-sialidase, partial [Clostridia bacterium]|nr:exo-alpha-sialidase [Clostridia bacterium]